MVWVIFELKCVGFKSTNYLVGSPYRADYGKNFTTYLCRDGNGDTFYITFKKSLIYLYFYHYHFKSVFLWFLKRTCRCRCNYFRIIDFKIYSIEIFNLLKYIFWRKKFIDDICLNNEMQDLSTSMFFKCFLSLARLFN